LRKLESDCRNVNLFSRSRTPLFETLSKIDDPHLRERAVDIQDVTRRVTRNLQGKSSKPFLAVREPHPRRIISPFRYCDDGSRTRPGMATTWAAAHAHRHHGALA
jgi:hypothetical protein